MRDSIQMLGQRFGKWVVIEQAPSLDSRSTRWQCVCDCGSQRVVRCTTLRTGRSRSCGCARGGNNKSHGMTKTPIYQLWQNMLNRCRNEKGDGYKNYGGRGIAVCERWLVFENFLSDMGEKPAGKSLDRLDNNKGYSPENCAWRTRREQGLNTRVNRMLTVRGITKPLGEWCEQYGVPRSRVTSRLKRGWDVERALTEPIKSNADAMLSVTRAYLEGVCRS